MLKKCKKFISHHFREESREDRRFIMQIGLSVLSMILCCALFCSTTFAWFTAQQRVNTVQINSAQFDVKAMAFGPSVYSLQSTSVYTCPLATGDVHTFVITATGTASTGYCEIKVQGVTVGIVQVQQGRTILLSIVAAQGTEIAFCANWGKYSGTASQYENEDSIVVSYTPCVSYTVAEGVTLEQIAKHYGVSESDILLYNGITELTVGVEIKIPNSKVTELLKVQAEPSEEATEPGKEGESATQTVDESASTTLPAEQENETETPIPTEPTESKTESDGDTEETHREE